MEAGRASLRNFLLALPPSQQCVLAAGISRTLFGLARVMQGSANECLSSLLHV